MSVTTLNRTTTSRPLLIVTAIVVALGVSIALSSCSRAAQVVHESVTQPLGAASSADVTIAMAIGRLRVAELDKPSTLIAGEIAYPDSNRVDRAFEMRGDTAAFSLHEQDSQRNNLVRYRNNEAIWDLRLTPATPMRLAIEAGVGESTLDLAQLKVTDLDLKTGIGITTLTLPRQGQVQAHVEGGVGNTTIRIPPGVATRIALDAELGKVEVLGNYQRQGNTYISQDYDSAANRVDLTVSGGIGTIAIQQLGQ